MNNKLYNILVNILLVCIIIAGITLCIVIRKDKLEDTKTKNVNTNNNVYEKIVEEEKNDSEIEETDEKETLTTKVVANNTTKSTSKKSTNNNTSNNSSTSNKKTENKKTDNNTSNNSSNNNENNINNNEDKKEEVINNNESIPVTNTTKTINQESVLKYLEHLQNEVITAENIEKCRKLAKSTFIEVTDFILYGTEINGYTFNELTDDMKVKVLTFASKLDSNIETYYPGYKDTIKSNFKEYADIVYNKYLTVKSNVCNKIGSDSCDNAKKGLEISKNLVKSVATNLVDAFKNWYSQYRTSN